MEGLECLSLTDDGLNEDPALPYTPQQLCHHVAARVLFAIPPPEGIIINLAIIIVSSGTLAMTIVVHELWHWHQPQLHLTMMGSP
jgi:hypothetical protein